MLLLELVMINKFCVIVKFSKINLTAVNFDLFKLLNYNFVGFYGLLSTSVFSVSLVLYMYQFFCYILYLIF